MDFELIERYFFKNEVKQHIQRVNWVHEPLSK